MRPGDGAVAGRGGRRVAPPVRGEGVRVFGGVCAAAVPVARARAEETAANRDDRLRAKILIAGGPGGSDEDEDDARRRRAAAFGDAALGDDEDHSESFSSAQATLLHLIREEGLRRAGDQPRRRTRRWTRVPPRALRGDAQLPVGRHVEGRGVVEAVASAKLVEESAEVNATAARCVLEECLGIWRVVTERRVEPRIVQTPGDVVSAACAMGLPRLLLALCAAMPPPTGAGQTSKASGPAAAPRLNAERVSPAALADGHPPFPARGRGRGTAWTASRRSPTPCSRVRWCATRWRSSEASRLSSRRLGARTATIT